MLKRLRGFQLKRNTTICLIILSVFLSSAIFADAPDRYYLRVTPADYKAALYEFNVVRGYDIAGVNRDLGRIDLLVSKTEYQQLRAEYPLEVLATPDELRESRVDQQYKEPDEIDAIVHQFNTDYPGITQVISIGQSYNGREIWAIKISDNPTWSEDEPVVLFNGQHHAREVMASEVCLDTIEFLCQQYGFNPDVTHWVDSMEIWVVPQMNVDGTYYVFHNYDMWRKDRFPNTGGTYGIDPNRNYPAFWGSCSGSSGIPSDDTYRGEFPRQSHCVDRLATFEESIRPIFDISYHSYSELVIYPYGCDGDYTPDQDALSRVGQEFAGLIERDNGSMGYTPGTGWEILYATDGGDTDWLYAHLGTFAYVVELNSDYQGFQPSYSQWRDDTVQRLRPAWMYLLNRIEGPGITGLVTDACTGDPVDAVVNLQEIPLSADETDRTTDAFGRYFRVLNPGEYHLVITATGYPDAVIPVTVGNQRVELDVAMVPDGAYGLYFAEAIIHDSGGDSDGVIDPGETVAIEVGLIAAGNTTNVSADLSSTDPYVTIQTGHAVFGNIPDGATGYSQSPHFVVSVDPGCPEQHSIPFQLLISADQALCLDTGSFTETVSTYVYQCPIYEETLDTNPGYEIDNSGSNGWEYGDPSSGPGSGHTGANCYGTNLDGDYGNYGNFNLISTPFDCSDISGTELIFWRWLRNESGYDTAYVEISTDHATWSVIWSGYEWDNSWTEQSFDISSFADGQPQVYVRWRLTSDSYVTELGYYLDDISICGETVPDDPPTPAPTWTTGPTVTPSVPPTVTPSPTMPPTATATVPTGAPTNTPVPTHTPAPTWTPTPTPTAPPGQPTYTPIPTEPPPTATQGPDTFDAHLILNSDIFEGGDPFLLELEITNGTNELLILDQYIILDVYANYFFYPGWSRIPNAVDRQFLPGYYSRGALLDFTWPANAGSADGLIFWLGYLRPGTIEVVGEIDSVVFGYR